MRHYRSINLVGKEGRTAAMILITLLLLVLVLNHKPKSHLDDRLIPYGSLDLGDDAVYIPS